MANSILQALAAEQQKQLQLQHQQSQEDDGEFGAQQRKRKTSCRTSIALNMEQKMRLIDYIHERPQIWDCSVEGFRSNQSRQSAFNEVAALLSDAAETFSRIQIQEEWGKLRYCFTRIMKKLLEEGGGRAVDEAQLNAISWPYWKRMEFLLPGVRAQLAQQTTSTESEGGIQEQGSPDNNKEPNASATAMPKVRRKRSVRKNSIAVIEKQEPQTDIGTAARTKTPPQQLTTQKFLMANIAALNTSQHLLDHFQQQKMLQNFHTSSAIPRQESIDYDMDREKNGEMAPLMGGVGATMSTAELVTALGAIKTQTNINIGTDKLNSDTEYLKRDNEFSVYTPSRLTNSLIAQPKFDQQPSVSVDLATNGWRHPSEGRRDSSEPDGESGPDIAESFGRCIVQQLQTVARKNPVLAVQMRRELMDVCFKYEMKACVIDGGQG